MATKEKKAGIKKDPAKKKDGKPDMKVIKGKAGKEKADSHEPLEEFQETGKTGRKTTDELAEEINAKKKKPAGTTIEKVKLGKKGLAVTLSVIEGDGTTTRDSKVLSRPVHQNFKNALAALAIHWLILNDYLSTRAVPDVKKYDADLIQGVTITGVSIGGNDGEEGIMITGHKQSRRKKAIVINTPFERFEEVSETRYKNMDDLEEKVKNLMTRTEKYLSGEEVGEDAQPELNFPEDELKDEGGEVIDPVED